MPLKAKPYRKPAPFESPFQSGMRDVRPYLLPLAAAFFIVSVAAVRIGTVILPGDRLVARRSAPTDLPPLRGYDMVGLKIPGFALNAGSCVVEREGLPPTEDAEAMTVVENDLAKTFNLPWANSGRIGTQAANFSDRTTVLLKLEQDPPQAGHNKITVFVTDEDGMGVGESETLLVDVHALQRGFGLSFDSWRTHEKARGVYEGEVNLASGPCSIEVALKNRLDGAETIQTAVFLLNIP